ncbi:hypothetical protein [Vibrio scophthalmi]|uniref:hypothetical protein n=1 Tax=Vibrio scophthalmi TaxID=45658 RepID=UPI001E4F4E1B|nr:hypothetical protein [Vibrio scophthalmi]
MTHTHVFAFGRFVVRLIRHLHDFLDDAVPLVKTRARHCPACHDDNDNRRSS